MADTLGGRSALRAEKNSTPGGAFRATRGKKTGPLGGRSALRAEKNRTPGGAFRASRGKNIKIRVLVMAWLFTWLFWLL